MTLLAGRYRLQRSIGRGGTTEVWEGVDEVLTRPVAVKLLHPQLAADEAVRERFRREAIAAARLAHPSVVATFDTGEDGDRPFIVMELIDGRSLRQIIAEEGDALRPALVAAIGIQVAEALQHAHDNGLVHRDVRPGNILVCNPETPGGQVRVKVADFGIGTAAAGDESTPGSDVHALGVVLYELLTGRPPAPGDHEPLRPRQLRAGIPRSLEAVVTKAMDKDPAARYQAAGDVASALRSIDDLGPDDAIPAVTRDETPPSGIAPTFRQTERTWLVPAAMIVIAAAVLIVIGVAFSQSDVGQDLLGTGDGGGSNETSSGAPVAVATVRSFDPEGRDRAENENRVAAAIDGNPGTQWETDKYSSQDFGRLKNGVGLVLEFGQATKLSRLSVTAASSGWSAQVYVAASPSGTLAGWGRPVDEVGDIGGSAQFDLGGTEGGAILLWITRLGADLRVEIAEVTVTG